MIQGIGMDIIEIERIRKLTQNQTKFINRILTERELDAFHKLGEKRQVEFLAGRFAAKEAFSKAFGTGIGKEIGFLDIETDYDQNGKPIIIRPIKEGVHLSITHSQEYAAAQVIIETI